MLVDHFLYVYFLYFLSFFFFFPFVTKKVGKTFQKTEKDYFHWQRACRAPICWSKYATLCFSLSLSVVFINFLYFVLIAFLQPFIFLNIGRPTVLAFVPFVVLSLIFYWFL